eukprot:SAG11_NODE_1023_length_6154_cov_3.841288_2_plen_69_part_00
MHQQLPEMFALLPIQLPKIPPASYIVALDQHGEDLTSREFAVRKPAHRPLRHPCAHRADLGARMSNRL